jgi:outer membrane lipase/esterase
MPDVPVANLSNAIQTIFNQGGRNFLIANLIDLGHSPLILQNSILVGSSGILSQQVEDFNGGLNIELDRLKRELPGIKMQLLDINALFEQAFAGKFEFQNLTMSCLNQVSATPCSHPDDYLFWDFIHPSARAHRLLGEAAISTVHPPTPTSVPEPATLLGLSLLGILGLATRCQPAKK